MLVEIDRYPAKQGVTHLWVYVNCEIKTHEMMNADDEHSKVFEECEYEVPTRGTYDDKTGVVISYSHLSRDAIHQLAKAFPKSNRIYMGPCINDWY